VGWGVFQIVNYTCGLEEGSGGGGLGVRNRENTTGFLDRVLAAPQARGEANGSRR
jgi:hypothetical protein